MPFRENALIRAMNWCRDGLWQYMFSQVFLIWIHDGEMHWKNSSSDLSKFKVGKLVVKFDRSHRYRAIYLEPEWVDVDPRDADQYVFSATHRAGFFLENVEHDPGISWLFTWEPPFWRCWGEKEWMIMDQQTISNAIFDELNPNRGIYAENWNKSIGWSGSRSAVLPRISNFQDLGLQMKLNITPQHEDLVQNTLMPAYPCIYTYMYILYVYITYHLNYIYEKSMTCKKKVILSIKGVTTIMDFNCLFFVSLYFRQEVESPSVIKAGQKTNMAWLG